ncbi:hypothetical protein, partial [Klebsiella variicola]|uniref:hypothetical protein n=1 Tax=Klebsiella variicola TaxID=244366 RepID=UPI001962D07A
MVSRPATCHNVIAGRRRTRFLNVLKNGFPAAPATLHGHAINCVPVHRFRIGRTPETGLTLAEWREFPRYALARILMHAVKTEPARFWRETGKTGNKPPENPPETRRLCFYGMHEYARKCIARKFTPFSQGKSCFRRSSYPKTV